MPHNVTQDSRKRRFPEAPESKEKVNIMRRKTFDKIVTAVGAVIVAALVAVGSLALWGYSYANTNVHNQLAAQKIHFPPRAAFAHAKPGTEITPGMIPYIEKYAGQEVLTGQQAEAYADHFIAVHLTEMPYSGVYASVSAAARAEPSNAKLKALETTVFQGTTLRGLLLEAYAFWTIGQVAVWGAIVAFALAAVMLALVLLGLVHLRRTPLTAEI